MLGAVSLTRKRFESSLVALPLFFFPFSVLNFGSVRLRLRSCFDPDKSRLFADEGAGGARLTGKAALILFFTPFQGSIIIFLLTPLCV